GRKSPSFSMLAAAPGGTTAGWASAVAVPRARVETASSNERMVISSSTGPARSGFWRTQSCLPSAHAARGGSGRPMQPAWGRRAFRTEPGLPAPKRGAAESLAQAHLLLLAKVGRGLAREGRAHIAVE